MPLGAQAQAALAAQSGSAQSTRPSQSSSWPSAQSPVSSAGGAPQSTAQLQRSSLTPPAHSPSPQQKETDVPQL